MAYTSSNGAYSGDERGESPHDMDVEGGVGGMDELHDKPVYLLEHLATFTVNKESGIVYPADGMRKLLQLEKTTGIWSQKMQLCLDRQWVLIMDYETGNIIERFPATLIQEPTAFTSNDPMEMYNNILVFIVGGETSSRSEMHIFQCQSISAIHLVEDLKLLRNGKSLAKYREPLERAPMVHNQASNKAMVRSQPDYHPADTDDSELGGLNDETSSTSSEKYERDVTVLNHCFDDIEKFIARLQHAAAASRELERRRRSRRSKKKDPGEGLLTLRTRPPHEKEFIDIFAKFKLSFNLLAKLKAHIHDPNAPELVHFLFTPLALIVDASHDSYYDPNMPPRGQDPNLPARVLKPLLTREAINLLINCVTSKETELWRSLGDPWTIPRDQWKGHTGSYHPVFFDGWSPDYPVVDDLEGGAVGGKEKKTHSQLDYHADYDFEGGSAPMASSSSAAPPTGSPVPRDFSATRSEISVDSMERTNVITSHGPMGGEVDAWLDDLQQRGAKIVQVTYPRTANNDKELTVVRGELLEVLDDTRKWWKARNSRGRVAHVPHTIVTQYPYADGEQGYHKGRGSESELQHTVMSAESVRNKHLGRGYSHQSSYDTDVFSSPDVNGNGGKAFNYMAQDDNNNRVAPPPPPPLPPQGTLKSVRSERIESVSSSTDHTIEKKAKENGAGAYVQQGSVQEELKTVLSLFREKRRTLDIVKTPEIFIEQASSSDDVQKWLEAKGFSPRVLKNMKGLTGNELLALNRTTLEDFCGVDEGKRLASQLNLQRNVSGYKTARSSELLAILAKARVKSEPTTS